MSSPYSRELEDLMSTLTKHLDSKLGTSAPSLTAPPPFRFGFQLSEKYQRFVTPTYLVLALAASVAWNRSRAPRTTSGEPQLSMPKVLMWWIVFSIPLVVYIFYRPK